MPQAVAVWVGTAVLNATSGVAGAYLASAATIAAYVGSWAALIEATKLGVKPTNESGGFRARELIVSSAKAPETAVYGQAWVGGVLMYANQRHSTGSKDNFEVYKVIEHAAHEVDDIIDLYYDNDLVTDASHIDWGAGRITAGKYGVTRGGVYAVNLSKHLGTSTQVAPALLTGAGAPISTDWTSAHRARGRAFTVHIFTMFSTTTNTPEAIFYSGVPQNIRALVKGRKIYDPRLDSTQPGGSGAHRFATPSTWAWSDNPILCYTDYRTQYMGVAESKIDWPWVMTQATVCDTLVAIPTATTQKRYTCNGVIALTNTHRENCEAILSSCLGYCPKVSGKWRPTAGAYIASDVTITEDDIVGEIVMTGGVSRAERYNTVSAVYYSANEFAQEVDALPVSSATYVTRDGVALTKSLALPMTNNEYMAQRIAYKAVLQSDRQIGCVVPLRWTGLQVAIGTRVNVNYAKFGWVNKVFRCTNWKLGAQDAPISVVLREDDSGAWADPAEVDYGTRGAQGTATMGTVEIPAPTAGAGASGETTVWNANFELGNRYWTVGDVDWTIANDAANAHQGEFVLKGDTPPSSRVTNYIRYPCTVGDAVTWGGWYKTSASLTGSIGFAASWLNSAGSEISNDNIAISVANTSWTELKKTARAPSGTHWVQFFVFSNGTTVGTVYADDSFMMVQAGAKLGENFYDSGGTVVGDNDALNSAVVTSDGGSFTWSSDTAGVYPAGDPTSDIVCTFYRNGTAIATHTVRGSLTTSTGVISNNSQATTGETTSYSETGDGTATCISTIKHTASNQLAVAVFSSHNIAYSSYGGGGSGK